MLRSNVDSYPSDYAPFMAKSHIDKPQDLGVFLPQPLRLLGSYPDSLKKRWDPSIPRHDCDLQAYSPPHPPFASGKSRRLRL